MYPDQRTSTVQHMLAEYVRSCSIPDDHIDPRRSAFFMARSVLGYIRDGVRAAIQASDEPASALAERFGTTGQTICKWKHRSTVHDRSHTPHHLQNMLTPAQEAVAVVLRTSLLVSIDDLSALAIGLEPMVPSMARCASS